MSDAPVPAAPLVFAAQVDDEATILLTVARVRATMHLAKRIHSRLIGAWRWRGAEVALRNGRTRRGQVEHESRREGHYVDA